MNVTILIGNLATDPELRQTASEKQVCSFRLAVSRATGSEADFFTVVAWDKQAEICAQYLATGRRIAVHGRLHQSTWETDGARRSRVEVIAHRIELLGAPKQKVAAFEEASDTSSATDTSDVTTDVTTASDSPFAVV